MGFLSDFFGKSKDNKKEESKESKIFLAKENDELMQEAIAKAKETFGYFWREQYWDYRRIIPALGIACVKAPFSQVIPNRESPMVEHMWINQVTFDGETVHGVLINQPNYITNVKNGDKVIIPFDEISDWMFSIMGKTYGGFTIQALRTNMSDSEKENHDKAWGLDFGDCNNVLLVHNQKEDSENLIEHPMCRNSSDQIKEFVQNNPDEATNLDVDGFSALQRESIAGNGIFVKALLKSGADKNLKNTYGKTAYDYAVQLNWKHIIELLG